MSISDSVRRADVAVMLFALLGTEVLAAAIIPLSATPLPNIVYTLFHYVPPLIVLLATTAAVAALPHRTPVLMLAVTALAFAVSQYTPIESSALKVSFAAVLLALTIRWLRVRSQLVARAAV